MTEPVTLAKVYLWGSLVGYVSWNEEGNFASFEYDNEFLNAPVEPSPILMPKSRALYTFRNLSIDTFKGLPGMLADSLPDKFGNALIDAWLSAMRRDIKSFNPVERLCYIGERGMGALEFKPATYKLKTKNVPIEIAEMVHLASEILNHRKTFSTKLKVTNPKGLNESLTSLLTIGTSAGGARAKCIIAYNEKTREVRSGQVKTTDDFSYWILKLDGVQNNKDKELNDPQGFGNIEYAYYRMALDCGIQMMESRLLEENNRYHFMTKRFDRDQGGEKLHMQSLCAIAHYDFNMAGAHSYEQTMDIIRKVVGENTRATLEEQFRRAIFNVIARNQDDHTKNIAFLMDKHGNWKLSPAFDMTYSYNPNGQWTNRHQMSINGKREKFLNDDLVQLGKKADLKNFQIKAIIEQTKEVVSQWKKYAAEANVTPALQKEIKKNLTI
ncbi:type II toxin-antitoxin system HipA family toxin [Leptospira kanakyensis]|uniref:Type II toxin-antitoxin system HipA family toxin n=1 Tax=Leptospira kanakyensis TaxID=2484968 RepID=A0A6N4Q7W1_9LEPT|nr:type II toxin-antitoxin system HipA family toxin [Leptospira kanakyensis]MCW7470777.1 type II toxin-antitoxin system HipA family toxin [Leptospira kanakyensis]MCW7483162.1 type II toxin-antitoxin system HipA family toxin [Leptospira kanakyensis]TGK54877.1 type II toxin-antitoxin system HipA family toxin [Leptospira kanakyensis]TGK56403.1 type II toxin-antitoxin system HipA family toxin [Leptospira kanakyensis]TGK75839.1 type II toxin-antitoxin system HipA family toxin [Leptospira kanakyensi